MEVSQPPSDGESSEEQKSRTMLRAVGGDPASTVREIVCCLHVKHTPELAHRKAHSENEREEKASQALRWTRGEAKKLDGAAEQAAPSA